MFARLVASVALILLSVTAVVAETRVALVIGNSVYDNVGPLINPKNDADDLTTMLEGLGFEVTKALDLDGAEFGETLANFRRRISTADVALFYYSGHGFQFDGENYLMPVDATLANEFSVQRETIALSVVLAMMEEAPISLVFVDACRNNPLADSLSRSMASVGRAVSMGRGLAPVRTTGRDMLVAFAAAPGAVAFDGVGRNSPFTGAILKHLPTPELEISTALKRVTQAVRDETDGGQQPEQLTSMATEFYMTRAIAVEAAPLSSLDPEQEAFRIAAEANTAASWEVFLKLYPEGRYAPVARVSLAALAPVEKSEPAPQVAGKSAEEIAALIAQKREETRGLLGKEDMEGAKALLAELVELGEPYAPYQLAFLSYYEGPYMREGADVARVMELLEVALKRDYLHAGFMLAEVLDRGGEGIQRDPDRVADLLLAALGVQDGTANSITVGTIQQGWKRYAEDTRMALQIALYDAGSYGQAKPTIDGNLDDATLQALVTHYENLNGTVPGQDEEDLRALRTEKKAALDAAKSSGAEKSVIDRLDFEYAELGYELGLPVATGSLGIHYMMGTGGVAADPSRAAELLELAMARGYALAGWHYGIGIDQGRAGAYDADRAATLILDAARAADDERLPELLEVFDNQMGRLLRQETRIAMQRIMADAGVYAGTLDGAFGDETRAAFEAYARLDETPQVASLPPAETTTTAGTTFQTEWDAGNYESALKLLVAEAEAKNPRAMGQYATFLTQGTGGVDRNIGLAMSYYEAAAALGDVASMFALAQIYDDGADGEVDRQPERAADLFLQGLKAAPDLMDRAHLGDLYRPGDAYFESDTRQYLQMYLSKLTGFTGAADGIIGTATQRALETWAAQ